LIDRLAVHGEPDAKAQLPLRKCATACGDLIQGRA
jgi:hypothetical protein